jgi:hypothetical protein
MWEKKFHKTTLKIIVSYILIFMFLDSRREDKKFWTEWQQALHEFHVVLISSRIKFWSITFFPQYLSSP